MSAVNEEGRFVDEQGKKCSCSRSCAIEKITKDEKRTEEAPEEEPEEDNLQY